MNVENSFPLNTLRNLKEGQVGMRKTSFVLMLLRRGMWRCFGLFPHDPSEEGHCLLSLYLSFVVMINNNLEFLKMAIHHLFPKQTCLAVGILVHVLMYS